MRWQYCWSWASGKHQLLKAFLPLSLSNFFFRENVSAPYLYLSNFAIPSNTEWIPVLPWLGLSRCPKLDTTMYSLLLSLYTNANTLSETRWELHGWGSPKWVLILWRDPTAMPAELTQQGDVLGSWAQPCGLLRGKSKGQRSAGFEWKQLWDEELAGSDLS